MKHPSQELFTCCEVYKPERLHHWPNIPYTAFDGSGGIKQDNLSEVRIYMSNYDVYGGPNYYRTALKKINEL